MILAPPEVLPHVLHQVPRAVFFEPHDAEPWQVPVDYDAQYHDADYFRNFTAWTCHWSDHNVALKFIRDEAELSVPDRRPYHSVPVSNVDGKLIAPIRMPRRGTSYTFVRDQPWRAWFWQEIIAMLRDEDIDFVLTHRPQWRRGDDMIEDDRGRGFFGCALVQTERYDHKRHCALGRHDGDMLRVWDFVLQRTDRVLVCLHPNWSSTGVECRIGGLYADHELPRTGLGGTSGPGTFRSFVNRHNTRTLRFDAIKSGVRRQG